MATLHKFEAAGLGIAPFRLARVEMRWFTIPGTSIRKPGWSCDYCATSIAECCILRDANGKEFVVGNECVHKTGDAGLFDTVKAALARLRRDARAERLRLQRLEALDLLQHPTVVALLSARPHPHASLAAQGKSMLDYHAFVVERVNSSVPATLKGLRQIAAGEVPAAEPGQAEARAAQAAEVQAKANAWQAEQQARQEAAKAAQAANEQANQWLIDELLPWANFDATGYAQNFFASIVRDLRNGTAMSSLPPKAVAIIANKLGGRSVKRQDELYARIAGEGQA